MSLSSDLHRLTRAAQGIIPCDFVIANVTYLDVFTHCWRTGNVGVIAGRIVWVDPADTAGLKAKRKIDGKNKWLVPGFIDAHVHIESSLMTPDHFEAAVLPKGTTTVFCDPHEIANVIGVDGIKYFIKAAERLSLDLRVMLSSCVPATTHLETNGAGIITARQLKTLAGHPKIAGLAEVMNIPGLLEGDQELLQKLADFHGRAIDGHCPLVRGPQLSACAAAGVQSCHESSELDEATEKLSKGIAIWIREGSVARDLEALAPLLTLETTARVGFCTDDRNPYDIATEGHIDHMIRLAIKFGVTPEIAYRSASYTVAQHYGLKYVGAIAPGYTADLVLLDDMKTCAINAVFKSGMPVDEIEKAKLPQQRENTVKAKAPQAADLEGPRGRIHAIDVTAGRILTGRSIDDHDARGLARLTVLERHGHGSKPANGYVRGFGHGFRGAIASSVGHDSHNLIATGANSADMRVALAALIESHGGFCVVQDGKVVSQLALPFGGLMSKKGPKELEKDIVDLREASRAVGCSISEPFLQLAFLSLPVIPSLKLTDKGLVDVEAFKIIDVRAN